MKAALLVGLVVFCSLWTFGSFLQCSKCQSSTSYGDCQNQVTLTNCSAGESCFQADVQLVKGADNLTIFQKGCLNSGSCDAYSRGEIGICISRKGQGYTGDCKGNCCDGDNCNSENLLLDKGSFLQCSKCQSSTSYDDCQSQVTLTNCSANQSCFQTDIQLVKAGAADITVFEKGCLNLGSCDAYSRGEIGFCISEKGQGYTGDCKGKCCDGDNCNSENLLLDKGSFLQCSKCQSSTSYDDCQSNVTLTNCSAGESCSQTQIQLAKGAETLTAFQKGCLNTGSCDQYSKGEIEICIQHKNQGYTGDCKGKCCDGDNCNRENLLPNKGTNKGSVFIISVMVLSGVLLTVVNIN